MKANTEDILDNIQDDNYLREIIAKAPGQMAPYDMHETRVVV